MTAVPAAITVPFEVVEATEGFVDGKFTATAVLECAWSNRLLLARQLLGSASLIAPGGVNIEYTLPAPHPFMAGAFVKNIPTIKGWPDNPDHNQSGPGSAWADYNKAHLTVTYEIPPWGTSPPGSNGSNYYIEENIEGSAEFRTGGVRGLRWTSDSTPLDPIDGPTRMVKKLVFTWRVAGIPTLPAAVLTLMGSCNDRALKFNTLGLVVGAETLLYTPPSLRRFIYANGAGAWDATFRFPYDPEGHNTFYRTGFTAKEPLQVNISTTETPNFVQWKPYPPRDFAPLGVRVP